VNERWTYIVGPDQTEPTLLGLILEDENDTSVWKQRVVNIGLRQLNPVQGIFLDERLDSRDDAITIFDAAGYDGDEIVTRYENLLRSRVP
jgi:hypothetical protein